MEILTSYEFTTKHFNRNYDRFERSQIRDKSYTRDISYNEEVIENIHY